MDNHATTPLDARVLDAMMPYFTENFGNPASSDHSYGAKAAEAVEYAREQVANLVNCSPNEIVFTSGATEADNLAIKGIAEAFRSKGRHIITCSTEHKAVLDTYEYLEKLGWSVTNLPVDEYGTIDVAKLESSIRSDTVLISVMFANNEIGTIGPVEQIGRIAKDHGVLFHSDAAQAVGHIPVDVKSLEIDMLSISGHKVNGPKGIGALFIRSHVPRIKPIPQMTGGGQEKGFRSGTLNVPGIVGFGKALELARNEMAEEAERLGSWTERMRQVFHSDLGAALNGHPTKRLPHNLNMSFRGIESKALIQLVSSQLAISASSACTTAEVEPSHVLLALGYDLQRAHSSVRIGLGRFTTQGEVDYAIGTIVSAVRRLQKLNLHEVSISRSA
jgi:cysteine desulfurase